MALRRLYGNAPQDLLRAVTNEAMHHVRQARDREAASEARRMNRTRDYVEGDDDKDGDWTRMSV